MNYERNTDPNEAPITSSSSSSTDTPRNRHERRAAEAIGRRVAVMLIEQRAQRVARVVLKRVLREGGRP